MRCLRWRSCCNSYDRSKRRRSESVQRQAMAATRHLGRAARKQRHPKSRRRGAASSGSRGGCVNAMPLTVQRLVMGMKLLGSVRLRKDTTVTISLANGQSAIALLEDVSEQLAAAALQADDSEARTCTRLSPTGCPHAFRCVASWPTGSHALALCSWQVACSVMEEEVPGDDKKNVRVSLLPRVVNTGCDVSFVSKVRRVGVRSHDRDACCGARWPACRTTAAWST